MALVAYFKAQKFYETSGDDAREKYVLMLQCVGASFGKLGEYAMGSKFLTMAFEGLKNLDETPTVVDMKYSTLLLLGDHSLKSE